MLKNILNLKGAQQLNKSEQNSIHGGGSSRCDDPCSGLGQGLCCGPDLGGYRRTCNSVGCCNGPRVKYCLNT